MPERQKLTVDELAHRLNKSTGAMRIVLGRLERDGLVERAGDNTRYQLTARAERQHGRALRDLEHD